MCNNRTSQSPSLQLRDMSFPSNGTSSTHPLSPPPQFFFLLASQFKLKRAGVRPSWAELRAAPRLPSVAGFGLPGIL